MAIEHELLKGSTPTLVLAVLRDGPLHGYGIARAIEQRSEDALRCKEGTLYPTLHALEREGLIAGEWRESDRGRQRRVYALTEKGCAVLAERTQAWQRFASAVQQVLSGDDHAGTDLPPRKDSPRRPLGRGPLPEPGG